jgi:purine-binding chemotaxis protein CheW
VRLVGAPSSRQPAADFQRGSRLRCLGINLALSIPVLHAFSAQGQKEAFMETNASAGLASEVKHLISFTVGDEEYGLELLRVKEVIRVRQITWLPKAPACVKGIINLRGDVIPIISLRDRFGLEAVEHTARTRVIVVEVEGRLVGMVVDSASQVVRVPSDQFDPPPQAIGALSAEFIMAVGKIGDKLVIMIDVDRILSTDEMSQIAGSLDAAEKAPAVGGA